MKRPNILQITKKITGRDKMTNEKIKLSNKLYWWWAMNYWPLDNPYAYKISPRSQKTQINAITPKNGLSFGLKR